MRSSRRLGKRGVRTKPYFTRPIGSVTTGPAFSKNSRLRGRKSLRSNLFAVNASSLSLFIVLDWSTRVLHLSVATRVAYEGVVLELGRNCLGHGRFFSYPYILRPTFDTSLEHRVLN